MGFVKWDPICCLLTNVALLFVWCLQVEGKDYLDHLSFCTKLMTSDKGPLSGCRGRAGVPMFGNVVFGGIEGEGKEKR